MTVVLIGTPATFTRCEERIDYPVGSTVGSQCEKDNGHIPPHKVTVSLMWITKETP